MLGHDDDEKTRSRRKARKEKFKQKMTVMKTTKAFHRQCMKKGFKKVVDGGRCFCEDLER